MSYPVILHGCFREKGLFEGTLHSQQERESCSQSCSFLGPISIWSKLTAPQRWMCFNIWEILVAMCWHLVWQCMVQIFSTSQTFEDGAGSSTQARTWSRMVLHALPSMLECQPQGGSCLQQGGMGPQTSSSWRPTYQQRQCVKKLWNVLLCQMKTLHLNYSYLKPATVLKRFVCQRDCSFMSMVLMISKKQWKHLINVSRSSYPAKSPLRPICHKLDCINIVFMQHMYFSFKSV